MSNRLTLDQIRHSLAVYFPLGKKIWGAVSIVGSVSYSIVKGLAVELQRVETWIESFRFNQIPDVTVLYLTEWENALGIPDDCFPGTGTDVERLLHVKIKLASLGIQSANDFVALAALFGYTITVEGGIDSGISFGTPKIARNTIVVTFDISSPIGFSYNFPILFTESETRVVECLFRKMKPACNDIIFVYV